MNTLKVIKKFESTREAARNYAKNGNNAPINKVGEFTMLIKLTSKVKTELKVVVTASEVVKESIEEEVTEETVEA